MPRFVDIHFDHFSLAVKSESLPLKSICIMAPYDAVETRHDANGVEITFFPTYRRYSLLAESRDCVLPHRDQIYIVFVDLEVPLLEADSLGAG
jgi:hypothetical protein